jgi:hypothetical protein
LHHLDVGLALARELTLRTQACRAQFDRAEALAALSRHAEAYEACREALQLEREEGREGERRAPAGRNPHR